MSFLYPPRPEKAIMPDMLRMMEMEGFSAEIKKNGTCSVLEYNEGHLDAWTRHNELHKAWKPDMATPCLRKLGLLNGKNVLVGELLHSKGNGHTDTMYLFDILIHEGKNLIGLTLAERRQILHTLWEFKGETYSHYIVDDRLWVAKPYVSGFRELFDGIVNPEDEGLVLKNPQAKLQPCFKNGLNAGWQVKCRKATKNYSF